MSDELFEMNFSELLADAMGTFQAGEKVTGTVTDIDATKVSISLDRCNRIGYIPLDELASVPVADSLDTVKIGDKLELVVILDCKDGIRLSKKRMDIEKAWEDIEKAYHANETLEGIVVEIIEFGIVVNVSGIRVFVPNSQIFVSNDTAVSEMVNSKVKLSIIEFDRTRRRVVGTLIPMLA